MLSPSDKGSLLKLARDTLVSLEDGDPLATFEEALNLHQPLSDVLLAKHPCFVTLKTRQGRVRGSTGVVQPSEGLFHSVHSLTCRAALGDSRFQPVEGRETSSLLVQISVLGKMRPFLQSGEWNPLEDGLFVRRGASQSILLNQFVREQGWKRAEQVKHHLLKQMGGAAEQSGGCEWFAFAEYTFQEAYNSPK